MAQFAAVVAVVFAALGFQIVAFSVLGLTLLLLLYGFITPRSQPEQGTGDTPE